MSIARTVIRIAASSLWLVVLGALFSSSANAQATDTVVFAHGLSQTGSSWSALAGDLQSRHPLHPFAPNTPSTRYYAVQADSLKWQLDNAFGGTLDDIAAIAHSNGGVVVREYVRATGSPRVNRLLTLGTPHAGAQLARSIQDGTALAVVTSKLYAIVAAFGYYVANDPDWFFVTLSGMSGPYAESLSLDVYDLFHIGFPTAFHLLGYLENDNWSAIPEVLPNMWPTSSFISTLNGSAALSKEQTEMAQARVGLASEYPSAFAPYRWAVPTDWHAVDWAFAVGDLASFALQAYWYYFDHPDWDLRNHAYLWQDLYTELVWIAGDWQILTGATSGPSDGIVPGWSSEYPQGTRNQSLAETVLSLHHVAQLDAVSNHDADHFRALISDAVDNDLGIVEPPPPPPPPPPLSASIGGPYEVQPYAQCNWYAIVSGGSGSYTYQWSGLASGTNWYVFGSTPQGGWLYLTVTSGSEQVQTQRFINTSWSAEECPE